MNSTTMKSQMSAFQLKGSVITLTVLELLKTELSSIAAQLSSLVHRTPDLFRQMPVIIELKKVQGDSSLDFAQLKKLLQENGLVAIGVKNASPEQQNNAIDAGLGILNNYPATENNSESRPKKESPSDSSKHTSHTDKNIPTTAKIITQPIRSGQQIYAKNSDLIILSSVSPGAEILACGNIHVYGTLHGRALAGVSGNKNARIFCRSLKAELVSIAGYYWVSEDISALVSEQKQKEKDQFFQIFLDNDKDHLQIGII